MFIFFSFKINDTKMHNKKTLTSGNYKPKMRAIVRLKVTIFKGNYHGLGSPFDSSPYHCRNQHAYACHGKHDSSVKKNHESQNVGNDVQRKGCPVLYYFFSVAQLKTKRPIVKLNYIRITTIYRV